MLFNVRANGGQAWTGPEPTNSSREVPRRADCRRAPNPLRFAWHCRADFYDIVIVTIGGPRVYPVVPGAVPIRSCAGNRTQAFCSGSICRRKALPPRCAQRRAPRTVRAGSPSIPAGSEPQCLMKGAASFACFFCCLIDFFSLAVCTAFFLLVFGGWWDMVRSWKSPMPWRPCTIG
jgi:hypothetical protein